MFKLGEWLVVCDRCGFKRMASQVVETWDGLLVCRPEIKQGCFETRHPLDFQRAVKDDPSVPFSNPRSTDAYRSDIPAYNCDTMDFRPIPNLLPSTLTIFKGRTQGPVDISDSVITVVCTWEIT